MFENESDHKGLFTFYREQAELEEKFALEQRLSKARSQYSKLKNNPKIKHNIIPIPDVNDAAEDLSQSHMNQTQKLSPKKSFHELNKAYIKQLSVKKQSSPQIKPKQLTSDIVVILKGNRASKEDLKLNKLDLKYQMQQGHFLKQKMFEPLQEVMLPSDQLPQTTKNAQESIKIKRKIKKNQSLNERYAHSKSQLENELILSKQLRPKRQNTASVKFQGIKKVDILNEFHELPELQRGYTSNHQSSNHLVHKRIPPKALASILKSQNNEIIRHLRKAFEKEKEEERKSALIQKNHSFIEYGSFDYDKNELDLAKLNEKQRRMINILNKFTKRG